MQGRHSGNLEKHIRRCHKDKVHLLEREKVKAADTARNLRQKRLGTTEVKIQMTARKLKLACVRLVAVHGRPFEMMNDEAFQDIVNPIIRAFPAREQ